MRPASRVEGSSDQVTPVFVLLVTVAVNCCVSPAETVAGFGLTVTATGGSSLTTADGAQRVLQQAVTVAVVLAGTEAGALYCTFGPTGSMVPMEAVHCTSAASGLLQSVPWAVRQMAEKSCDPPCRTSAAAGETSRLETGATVGLVWPGDGK